LEHSRIFYFHNNGKPEFYMGSADWMPRNLDRRVEIIFPVYDENIKEKVMHILDVELRDTLKAYYMDSKGEYHRPDLRGKEKLGSQATFCAEATHHIEKEKQLDAIRDHRFIPATPPQE
ncbi:MAG: RNA degradosome polyphosphate kinase, partial [Lachnospiraceae bacterium]|nr:RNA degradosome polyphosphate kinase [Lachnospiraceae bacterium]